MTSGLPQNYEVPQDYGLCFYLDHKSSITLTMSGKKYKNPIFYCPGNASDIKFEPSNTVIYYTKIFDLYRELESLSSYITTKDISIKVPNVIVSSTIKYYYSMIIAPIPSLTFTCSGNINCSCEHSVNYCPYI